MTHASPLPRLLIFALVALALPLRAQVSRTLADPLGFTYTLPNDWQTIVPKPQPGQLAETQRNAAEEAGMACVKVPITARHGEPASVIVIVGLPFACFGQTIPPRNLPDFAAGITAGLKSTIQFLNPVTASYALAGHQFWIERVKATPKAKTTPVFTVEIACTILRKGAVCWTIQAATEAALNTFEATSLSLEGSPPMRLVPRNVFVEHPAPSGPHDYSGSPIGVERSREP